MVRTLLLLILCGTGTLACAQQVPRFDYRYDYAAFAAGSAFTAVTSRHHDLLAANAFQWTAFAFAGFSGRKIADGCKIEDARAAVLDRFGTAPVYGMPSHYYRNTAAVNAGVSLASFLLHHAHHDKLARWLPLSSGAFQAGFAAGNLSGSCN